MAMHLFKNTLKDLFTKNTNVLWLFLLFCGFSYVHGLVDTLKPPESDSEYGTLVLANIIYRHGDRTPVQPYPLDPYKNLSYWPVGWGQLTNRGKEQHFELGQWLRKRYGKLLSNLYSKDDIFVRSTDVDRTLMSAESNLAGLFQPVAPQLWNPDVKWQPIPVHTVPEELDEVLAAKRPCPRYNAVYNEVKKSKAMQEIDQKYASLYQYLSKHTGENVSDIQTVEYLYNTLYIENLYNFTLPAWTQSVYPDKMAPAAALSFTVSALTLELQRLKSGPLLGEITQHIKQKIENRLVPDRKMFVYSGHDVTIANMLMTLGVFDVQIPPYTSTIFLELWQKNEEYFVTLMYRNSTEKPYLLKLPGCVEVCPIKIFLALTRPLIPTNWTEECKMPNLLILDPMIVDYPSVLLGLLLFSIFVLLVAACIVMALVHFRPSSLQYRYQRLPMTMDDALQTA